MYQEVYGWERPYWYARKGIAQEPIHTFRRSALHASVGAEVRGLRETVGIADLSAFAKLEIHGADAPAFLARVSSNRLPEKVGSIVLTYFVNRNGRLEGEARLVKLGEQRFYAVYAAVKEAALLSWLEEQRRDGEAVSFDNLSEAYGVLMLAGP